jgi:hypothetical protein
MSISKARKEKRRGVHYKTMCVAAVLDGLHPSWLPANDQGNLRFARYEIESMLRTIREYPASVYAQPRNQHGLYTANQRAHQRYGSVWIDEAAYRK